MAEDAEKIRASRAEGRKLAEALRQDWRPSPMSVAVQLTPGEYCYATGRAEIWQFAEGDGTYLHKTRFGLSAVGLAMAATAAVGNGVRRARAAREAEARFRPMDAGPLFVTNQRLAVQGGMQWIDLWYENIRMSDCDGIGITLHTANNPPIRIYAWPPDYFFVMFRFLSTGAIMQVPVAPS